MSRIAVAFLRNGSKRGELPLLRKALARKVVRVGGTEPNFLSEIGLENRFTSPE